MSARASGEVWQNSRAEGTALLVLLALADQAGDDGVTWLQIESSDGKKSITRKARCSRATASRAIDALVTAGELQVVKVRRGRSTVNVYRVVVGRIRDVPVDYDRLPFDLPHPFISPSQIETVPTVSNQSVHRLNGDGSPSHPGESLLSKDLDPSRDTSVVQEEHPEIGDEEDPDRGRHMLRFRSAKLRRERSQMGVCDECQYAGGGHEPGCVSGRETIRQSYGRFVDEVGDDPSYPLDELAFIVHMWRDIDDVERQEFLERAELRRAAALAAPERSAAA